MLPLSSPRRNMKKGLYWRLGRKLETKPILPLAFIQKQIRETANNTFQTYLGDNGFTPQKE